MSDATSDGGAREASTIDLELTEVDAEPEAVERPRGKPGRRPKGSVPAVSPICLISRILVTC